MTDLMHMTKTGALAVVALMAAPIAAQGGPTDTALGSSPADVARIRAMDVAGVRLGMTPEQARAGLRAAGYSPTPDPSRTDRRQKVSRNYDYATRVDQARRQRLGDFAGTIISETVVGEDWSRGDEGVSVSYVPTREGVRASAVTYTIPEGRIGWDGIRSNAIARYGRPTRLSDGLHTGRWCGDGACAPLGAMFADMSLTDGWRLELSDGGAFERLSRVQAAADADASIRKTDKPSF